MALLHPSSTEAMRSEVDLWTLPSTVGNIERTRQQACKPTAGYTQSNTMTFHVPGTNALIDAAHNMLHIVAEVVKADGSKLKDKESDVSLVNYGLHSIFSQVDVTIGNTVVSQSSLTYPYRAHIEALLGYDRSAKESHMTMRGWFKDTAGHMDDFAGDKNEGLAARRKLVKNSRMFELMGPLHCDFLTNQAKFLLPNTDLTIKLTRSADAFALMSTNKNEKIIIHDATLFFRKVELSPSLNLAHAQALEHAPARYPLTRTNVKTITIPAGLRDKTIANLHIGQIPKRIVVGFVSNIAFNGSYHHNPFNYQNFDLNYMVLYVDTEQIPAVPLTPDFSKGTYMQAYNTLFCGTGIHWKDEGNNISYDEYGNGYTLYAFDLTPDLSSHEAHWNLQKQGVVRLDVRFRAELPIAVNCVVYSEFDNLVEISKDRHVVVDYNV
ncbi:hypothetical protein KUF71_009843 [Frankliniella fusca]|uniref:Uncharacterized protein n=1 Tax=Frankliniella fusca TaxID=407009 RepID=A0AAE1H6C3_9NEOP|nr:hypothetical protein KUF71_024659 [Frankliniella fusca]KAK3920552.1 hypothetical protein KUF71_009823 [Frankliniella fusca]KAK3920572.1 hypothetical protein KUF71_009843 [Frankliniella fusca]